MYFDLLIIGEGESILENAINLLMNNSTISDKTYINSTIETPGLFQNLKIPNFVDISWDDYLRQHRTKKHRQKGAKMI